MTNENRIAGLFFFIKADIRRRSIIIKSDLIFNFFSSLFKSCTSSKNPSSQQRQREKKKSNKVKRKEKTCLSKPKPTPQPQPTSPSRAPSSTPTAPSTAPSPPRHAASAKPSLSRSDPGGRGKFLREKSFEFPRPRALKSGI